MIAAEAGLGPARRLPDLSLYLVLDPAACTGAGPEAVARAAAAGGVTLVQLRAKTLPDPELAALAMALRAVLRPLGIPLIVNDRARVAVAADAEGLHIGQGDGDPVAARAAIGPRRLLGLSIEAPDQLARLDPAIVDYVGAGPVFPTPSKPDAAPATGFDGLAAIVAACPVPVVAIGGLGPDSAAASIAAGAAGIAVVSAICAAPDPEAAARALRHRIDAARAPREGANS
jgi:thiamine-phosphate pyrophosphorylase